MMSSEQRNYTLRIYGECLCQLSRGRYGYFAEIWCPDGFHFVTLTYSAYLAAVEAAKEACRVFNTWGCTFPPDELISLECRDFIYRGWVVKVGDEAPHTGRLWVRLIDPLGEFSRDDWLTETEFLEHIDRVERLRLVPPGQLSIRGLFRRVV